MRELILNICFSTLATEQSMTLCVHARMKGPLTESALEFPALHVHEIIDPAMLLLQDAQKLIFKRELFPVHILGSWNGPRLGGVGGGMELDDMLQVIIIDIVC